MPELKKKIRPGAIELHPGEPALVVHYEVQAVEVLEDGTQERTSSSAATKKISLRSLAATTDLQQLAQEVVEKCKLIHPSKVSQVEGLLRVLQLREAGRPQAEVPAGTAPGGGGQPSSSSSSGRSTHEGQPGSAAASEAALQQQHWKDQPHSHVQRPSSSGSHRSKGDSPSDSRVNSPAASNRSSLAGAAAAPSSPSSSHSPGSGVPGSSRTSPAYVGQSSDGNSSGRPKSRSSRPHQQQQQAASHFGRLLQGLGPGTPSGGAVAAADAQTVVHLGYASELFEGLHKSLMPAFMEDLEDYVEGLYEEDLAARTAAAGAISQLFRSVSNFEALLARDSLIPTLARLLRDDGRKSLELATHLTSCCFCLSTLQQCHQSILDNQVGTLVLELLELEIQRSAARVAEEGVAAAPLTIAARLGTARKGGEGLTDREAKLAAVVARQDTFLLLSVGLLHHLSEDPAVARKMRKKDIVALLVPLLSRPHVDVVLMTCQMLQKLSVVQENKDRMASCGVLQALLLLLSQGTGEEVQGAVLRLLHNLSFDETLRGHMATAGFLPKVVELFTVPRLAPLGLGIAYHMSMLDNAKGTFIFTEALQRLYEMLLRSVDLRNVPELIALCINLSHSARVAEWFLEGQRLQRLASHAFATADQLVFKLLRNLLWSGGMPVACQMVQFAADMLALLRARSTCPEVFLEVLGCLAAAVDLTAGNGSAAAASGVTCEALLQQVELVPLLLDCLAPGALDDDALLEAVMLAGALCGDATVAETVASSGMLLRLAGVMADKRTDDELVVQVAWALSKALQQEPTRAVLLQDTQVVLYMVDLLQDTHPVVRAVADSCLDCVLDWEESWAVQIRNLKFEAANQEWLALAQQQQQPARGAGVGPGSGSSAYSDGSITGRAGLGSSAEGWRRTEPAVGASRQEQHGTGGDGGRDSEGWEVWDLGGVGSISGKNSVQAGGQFMVFDVVDYTAEKNTSGYEEAGWGGVGGIQSQQGVGYVC